MNEDNNNEPNPTGHPYKSMEEITVTEHWVRKLPCTKDQPTKIVRTRHDLCQDTQGTS